MEKNRIERRWQNESLSFILDLPKSSVQFFATMAIAILFISGCANHPCREPRAPELDSTAEATKTQPTTVANMSSTPAPVETDPANVIRVRVYKPDGSRQCEKRAGILLETMERELAGIVVYNREKRSDGLMHIQVCGSPSGMINLFEIDIGFLKQAEQRGFKRWED